MNNYNFFIINFHLITHARVSYKICFLLNFFLSSLLNDALNAFVSWLIFLKTHSVNFLYKFFFSSINIFYKLSCCFKLFLLLFIHLFVVFFIFLFLTQTLFSLLYRYCLISLPKTVAYCYRCCYCCCGDEYIFNCGWLLSYWFPLVSGYALCLKNKKTLLLACVVFRF